MIGLNRQLWSWSVLLLIAAGSVSTAFATFPLGSASYDGKIFDRSNKWDAAPSVVRIGTTNYVFFCGQYNPTTGVHTDAVRVFTKSGNMSQNGIWSTTNIKLLDYTDVPWRDGASFCAQDGYNCVCDPAFFEWANTFTYNNKTYKYGMFFTVSKGLGSDGRNEMGLAVSNTPLNANSWVVIDWIWPIPDYEILPSSLWTSYQGYGVGMNDVVISKNGTEYLYGWTDTSYNWPIPPPSSSDRVIRLAVNSTSFAPNAKLKEALGVYGTPGLFGHPSLAYTKSGSNYRIYVAVTDNITAVIMRTSGTITSFSQIHSQTWQHLAAFDSRNTGCDLNNNADIATYTDGELYIESSKAFVFFACGMGTHKAKYLAKGTFTP